jgi:Dna[CI] antecedent DciA-like protein
VDKLGNLLARVIAKQPNNRQIAQLRFRLAFLDLLGPELAGSCDDVELRGTILTVSISNPALAHQLRLDAGSLVSRLNALGLPRTLRAIKVRTGRAGRQST